MARKRSTVASVVLRAGSEPAAIVPLERDEEAESAFSEAALRPGRESFETGTGLSVTGTPPAEPTGRHEGWGDEGPYWFIRGESSASIMFPIDDETFACVGMFPGLIADVHIHSGRVQSLRYRPALDRDDEDYFEYGEEGFREMLAMGEALALSGNSELVHPDGVTIAGNLRPLKHVNPMFGVYAAYAYADAGVPERAAEMIQFYLDRGEATPFDIWMMTTPTPDYREASVEVAPSFPVMTRGWSWLHRSHPAIEGVRGSLLPGSYTTVRGPAALELAAAVASGEIK